MSSQYNNPPPTATAVNVTLDNGDDETLIQAVPVRVLQLPTGNNGPATPVYYFEYSKENMERDELLTASAAASIPVAPTLAGYEDNSPQAQAVAASAKTRLGSDIGRINALEEKERIRAISRMAQSKPYHEKARIEAGGIIALSALRRDSTSRTYFPWSAAAAGY